MDIKAKVHKLVRFYKSRNPFEMINGMNVILVSYPLNGVRGFYQYFQRNHIIYIDERLPDHEKILVCAHELGHMFLHKKANAVFMDTRTHFKTSNYEREANIFAMELLLPDELMWEFKESGYTKEQISRITGYHEKLIDLKLKSIGKSL